MAFFKEWCFCVCITLIISVIFSLFTPNGAMNRFYKVMLSIFIVISFLYPLKDFSVKDIDFTELESSFDEQANTGFENEMSSYIKSYLKSKGISGANADINANYDTNTNQIEIYEASVYIPDEYSKEEVEKLIFDGIGINARVIYIGE